MSSSSQIVLCDYLNFFSRLQDIFSTENIEGMLDFDDQPVFATLSDAISFLSSNPTNITDFAKVYDYADGMISYFSTPKLFHSFSSSDFNIFLRLLNCIRDDFFLQKASVLRTYISTSPCITSGKNPATTLYCELLHAVQLMDDFIEQVNIDYKKLSFLGQIPTFVRNDELNTRMLQTVKKLRVIVKASSGMISFVDKTQQKQPKKTTLPFDRHMYPNATTARVTRMGRLPDILDSYASDTFVRYDKYPKVCLFSKEKKLFELPRTCWNPNNLDNYCAYIVYALEKKDRFIVNPPRPECFLVVVKYRDAQNIESDDYKKEIFIEGTIKIKNDLHALLGRM